MAERTFHTPEPIELEVQIPVGDIEVETIDGDTTTIEVSGSEKLVEQVEIEQRGRTIVVAFRGKHHGIVLQIGGFNIGGGELRVRARVPHASDAKLTTASADMVVRGRVNRLETKSASGDLVVVGDIAGEARLKTVSGDVVLGGVAEGLSVQSVSGDVRADTVGGDVEAKTVSGDVRVVAQRGTTTVQSVSGDIEIGVAAGTNLDVDAGSVSGDLTSEVPLGSDTGSLADGPTLVVRGKTVSGDFRVFRAA
ncbi:MAG TPA: DUF4097 family beta strand repeat-containing protein [Gaiellaceae bacterium]|nr:DUF4097 family beta strand repeat-containing protein [Gaiellaceae bacterium]